MDFTLNPYSSLTLACALVALTTITLVWAGTRGARARATERARIWGEAKRPEIEARAARKREARASGARTQSRIRGALLIAVALVALGATNLSAHGTLDMIARAGLESLDAQIAVIVVFEMFLAILGALSYWHMHHGTGFNKYEAGVWAMASLMGVLSWWGAGSMIFALWPLLAAVAWHMVITFGRPHKPSALITWWRMKRGKATSQDATAVMTERLITQIVDHGYGANAGHRFTRAFHERAFNRAWARADALGILTPEVRARIQTRIAARYVGARALAPEAVAHMNPWNERASMSARTTRAVRPVSAPPAHVVEVSAQTEARTDERASDEETSARTLTDPQSSLTRESVLSAFEARFIANNAKARAWVQAFIETNGELPSAPQLAVVVGKNPATCRRWLAPVREELGLS